MPVVLGPDQRKIERTLNNGKNHEATTPGFIVVPLNVTSLQKIVNNALDTHDLSFAEHLVGKAGSQVLIGFNERSAGNLSATIGRVYVEVSISNSLVDTQSSLAHRLLKFERNPAEIANATPVPLGSFSFAIPNEVFFLHGNAFARVFITTSKPSDQQIDLLMRVAIPLANYMAHQSPTLPTELMPHPKLSSSSPHRVKAGERFTLSLESDSIASTLDEKFARVSDPTIVQWLGPIHQNGHFEFAAFQEGRVDVSLIVAHKDSLITNVEETRVIVAGQA
ncbi:hypothetical protein N7462_009657 [Penicillium macrosclerotiorum]|uniref:uncharacterized protein n=1 Tax=Penicillium macrosclerotiorum TaxID=303699 RepID=UPI0025492E18|nr:uncharacterized protein N7462_009657 [Penicillium macrosclerotiorum]KAJ5674218.1 hypothetical protein N7462_009657 [Penicillium macrosclerotiorum]